MPLDKGEKTQTGRTVGEVRVWDAFEACRRATADAGLPPRFFWHLVNTGNLPKEHFENQSYEGYRRGRLPLKFQTENLRRGLIATKDDVLSKQSIVRKVFSVNESHLEAALAHAVQLERSAAALFEARKVELLPV